MQPDSTTPGAHAEQEQLADRVADDAARARPQHQAEMENALIAQEQDQERGTGVPIVEQADGSHGSADDGEDAITAGQGQGSAQHGLGEDGSGLGIVSPGQGTADEGGGSDD